MPSTRWQSSPRFGALPVCLPPRSLKKPRPNEARAFLVPKFPSLVAFPLVGEEELRPVLFRPYEKGKKHVETEALKHKSQEKKAPLGVRGGQAYTEDPVTGPNHS